jgi:hypothetical protein
MTIELVRSVGDGMVRSKPIDVGNRCYRQSLDYREYRYYRHYADYS